MLLSPAIYSVDCLQGRPHDEVLIYLQYFIAFIEEFLVCGGDYILISDDDTGAEIQKLCQAGFVPPIHTGKRNVRVEFFSDSDNVTMQGFLARYYLQPPEIARCGGVYTDHFGRLQPPPVTADDPLVYCWWSIQGERFDSIVLRFDRFGMLPPQDGTNECFDEYFQIEPGNQTVCGDELSGQILFYHIHRLDIYFLGTNTMQIQSGNLVEFQYNLAANACGANKGVVIGDKLGLMFSPNYPYGYQGLSDCAWELTAPVNEHINFEFLEDFAIDESSGCTQDYIEIQDLVTGKNQRFCGTQRPTVVVDTLWKARVVFVSNADIHMGAGFFLQYSIIPPPEAVTNVMLLSQGTLMTPNFPSHWSYPSGQDFIYHKWMLQGGKPYHNVMLSFHPESILAPRNPLTGQCEQDWLKIEEDPDDITTVTKEEIMCGNQLQAIQSKIFYVTNLRISFMGSSQESFGYKGFSATYNLVASACDSNSGAHITEEQGYLMSPNYPQAYLPNSKCEWTMAALPGKNIIFHFIGDFDVVGQTADCVGDYVLITDLISNEQHKFCNSAFSENVTVSHKVKVEFITSGDGFTGKGFMAKYDTQEPMRTCGANDMLKERMGYIETPNYPSNFNPTNPNYHYCVWSIEGEKFDYIMVTSEAFDLSDEKDVDFGFCSKDYLHIHPENLDFENYCGQEIQNWGLQSFPTSEMYFGFYGTSADKAGFRLRYDLAVSACGEFANQVLTHDSGLIVTKGYQHTYEMNLYCSWTIHSKPLHDLTLEFVNGFSSASVHITGPCEQYDYIKITDILTGTVTTICTEPQVQNVNTKSQMLVEFKTNNDSIMSTGFVSNYTAKPPALTTTYQLDDTQGYIAWPDMSGSSVVPDGSEYVRVLWNLMANADENVILTVTEFSIHPATSGYCDTEYLQVKQKSTWVANTWIPLITHPQGRKLTGYDNIYCGDGAPITFNEGHQIVHDNNVEVEFLGQKDATHTGFNISYHFVNVMCSEEPVELTAMAGSIMSKDFPNGYDGSAHCSWLIKAPPANWTIYLEAVTRFERPMPGNSECDGNDYLLVTDITTGHQYKLCDNDQLMTAYAGSTMQVEFVTDKDSNVGAGFFADYKMFDRNPCQENSCEAGSTCQISDQTAPGNLGYICLCPPGLTGQFCESEYEPCASAPCLNGGSCEEVGNDYSCTCLATFTGKRCEVMVFPCDDMNICGENSMACVNGPHEQQTYTCQCKNYFVGDKCQHAPRDTVLTKLADNIYSPYYPSHWVYPTTQSFVYYTWTIKAASYQNIMVDEISGSIAPADGTGICKTDFLQIDSLENLNVSPVDQPNYYCGSNMLTQSGFRNNTIFHSNTIIVRFYGSSPFTPQSSAYSFKIPYEFVTIACGEDFGKVLTARSGLIMTPNYPSSHPPNSICQWTIQGQVMDTINIFIFPTMDLVSNNPDCNKDTLVITDLEHQNSTNICHDTSVQKVTVYSNHAQVVFKSDDDMNIRIGFLASYSLTPPTQTCGSILEASSGIITNPSSFGVSNTDFMYCEWTIKGMSNNIIVLEVTSIELAPLNVQGECLTDYLMIGETTYCGGSSSNTGLKVYHQPELTIRFLGTSQNNNNLGFFMKYSLSRDGCGLQAALATEPVGYIVSPNYPQLYSEDARCKWTIQAPLYHRIEFEFTKAPNIEPSTDCTDDYILITDQAGNQIDRFCGSELPPSHVINENVVNVEFITDHDSNVGLGFLAKYNMLVPIANGTEVMISSMARYGIILSPNFPEDFAPAGTQYVFYTWTFAGEESDSVLFTINSFSLQPQVAGACTNEYVSFGSDSQGHIKLCGRNGGKLLFKLPNQDRFQMQFFGLDSLSSPGFSISYDFVSSLCGANAGGTLTDERGYFMTPNFPAMYDQNDKCEWLLKGLPGDMFHIKFEVFDVEDSWTWPTCNQDHVEITDLVTNEVFKICDENSEKEIITHHRTQVKFINDFDTNVGHGFIGEFFSTTSAITCGNYQMSGRSGRIESPGYPGSFLTDSSYAYCRWHIQGEHYDNIWLDPQDFQLSSMHENVPGGRCDKDYLQIRPKNMKTLEYCGTEMMASSYSPFYHTYGIDVGFYGSSSEDVRGFALNYKLVAVACGSNANIKLTDDFGSLMTSNHPSNYDTGSNCAWTIWAKPLHTIVFSFGSAFSISASANCEKDYVALTNITSQPSTPIKFCDSSPPTGDYYGVKELAVTFHSDLDSLVGTGFLANYTSVPPTVTYDFMLTASSGKVAYPITFNPGTSPVAIFDQYMRAVWSIQGESYVNILLTINNMKMRPATEGFCNDDYLSWNKPGTWVPNLWITKPNSFGKWVAGDGITCGEAYDDTGSERGHLMFYDHELDIELLLQRDNSDDVVDIDYRMVSVGCKHVHGTILTENTGAFMSPNFPAPYHETANCSWLIQAPSNETVIYFEIITRLEQHVSFSNCTDDYVQVTDLTTGEKHKFCDDDQLQVLVLETKGLAFVEFITDGDSNVGVGFFADYVFIDPNACDTVVCQNEGVCVNSLDGPKCSCAAGFTGTNCESTFNACDPNPCHNGGVCTPNGNEFTCQCIKPYTGDTCLEIILPCSQNPCNFANTASCVNGLPELGNFTCICKEYYNGNLCQNRPCFSTGSMWEHGSIWPQGDNCNSCQCNNSTTKCTKIYCPTACSVGGAETCVEGENCVASGCLTGECGSAGKCVNAETGTLTLPAAITSSGCTTTTQTAYCAVIEIVISIDALSSQGAVTIDDVCKDMREMEVLRDDVADGLVVFICALVSQSSRHERIISNRAESGTLDATVTINSQTEKAGILKQKLENALADDSVEKSDLLKAVRVQTPTVTAAGFQWSDEMTIIVIVSSVALLVCIGMAVFLYKQHKKRRNPNLQFLDDDIEKTHLQRETKEESGGAVYSNPTFDEDGAERYSEEPKAKDRNDAKAGPSSTTKSTEESDRDNYDKLESTANNQHYDKVTNKGVKTSKDIADEIENEEASRYENARQNPPNNVTYNDGYVTSINIVTDSAAL